MSDYMKHPSFVRPGNQATAKDHRGTLAVYAVILGFWWGCGLFEPSPFVRALESFAGLCVGVFLGYFVLGDRVIATTQPPAGRTQP